MAFKRTVTDPVPERQEASYEDKGIDTFTGERCSRAGTRWRSRARPCKRSTSCWHRAPSRSRLNIPGDDHGVTKEGFLSLKALPVRIVLVGDGESTLVDDLLTAGYVDVTVLDFSTIALNNAKQRAGSGTKHVAWLAAEVLEVDLPPASDDVWCDPDVFHFMFHGMPNLMKASATTMAASTAATPFQKRTGWRSTSGGRVLCRNALFGWRRSWTYSVKVS